MLPFFKKVIDFIACFLKCYINFCNVFNVAIFLKCVIHCIYDVLVEFENVLLRVSVVLKLLNQDLLGTISPKQSCTISLIINLLKQFIKNVNINVKHQRSSDDYNQ